MKKINAFLFSLLGIILLNSCLKDKGNYEYNNGTYVRITHPTYSYPAFLNDTLTIYANRQFNGGPEDSLKFDHAWYINGKLYSDKPELNFTSNEMGSYSGRYYMIDKETGIHTGAISGFTINVTSPFSTGWIILYEKNGKSELGHIRVTGGQYFDYTDLYKSSNDGEEMGSKPIMMNDFFPARNNNGLFVIQHGGQGSIEINGLTYKKQLVTKNSFSGAVPSDLKPVDAGFFATSDMLVNHNGDVYPRYFNNPLPFTTPWLSLPMQVDKGMKISDIWKSWGALSYAFMFDKLNNRILQVRLDAPNTTGGIAVIDTFPYMKLPGGAEVPEDYVYPNDLNDWEYVWGGTFNDKMYAGDGAFLIKDPADQKVYLQTFISKSVNRVFEWYPKFKMYFPGTSVINGNSKYLALKSRDYLLFTGGANNSDLYYFDVLSKTVMKLYQTHSSRITVLKASDNDNEIAVGLEDGTVIIYDVSHPTMIAGAPIELHRLSGLGKVADIEVKNSRLN